MITDGFYHSNYGKGFAGAIVVAVVALLLEVAAAGTQRLTDPLRRARQRPGGNGHTGTERMPEVAVGAPRDDCVHLTAVQPATGHA